MNLQEIINTNPWEQETVELLTDKREGYCIIVWNDEVNSFDWVIETLVDVCGHSFEQAEQCAMIIHHNGKYAVKEGDIDDLKPMCEAISERGISATIEQSIRK